MAVKTLSAEIKELVKYPALPVTANSLDVAETAPNDTNGCDYVPTGREIVVLHNTTVGAATFTLVSSADPYGRTGDITAYSLGAGEFAALIPPSTGFLGAGGKITITVSDPGIKFLVMRVPNTL